MIGLWRWWCTKIFWDLCVDIGIRAIVLGLIVVFSARSMSNCTGGAVKPFQQDSDHNSMAGLVPHANKNPTQQHVEKFRSHQR